jgi:hypothetical protein
MNNTNTHLADAIVDRLAERLADINKTIHYTELPSLAIGDAARYLGVSLPHVHKLMQRYPEHLAPLDGHKSIRFSTEQLIDFKRTGLAKAISRKPVKLAWDADL